MTIFPELEQQFRAAAREHAPTQQAAQRPRHRSVSATALVVGLALAGGTAFAATQAWDPIFGGDGDRVSVAQGPLPQAQVPIEVLRREAADADKTAAVQATLSQLSGRQTGGIYPESVRALGAGSDNRAVIVFASQRAGEVDDQGNPQGYVVTDPICLAYPDIPGSLLYGCWTPKQVAEGEANTGAPAADGFRITGLVPDGVATVRLVRSGYPDVQQQVTDNFFTLVAPSEGRVILGRDLVWLDDSGQVIDRR